MAGSKIRVRFAPSPTGHLHVGNARTALFNWLFARQAGGTFILRIEDTDVERSDPAHEKQLIADLKWLGLDWDEGPDLEQREKCLGDYGPYRQSDRLAIYREHAERLLAEGKAYLCFCTPEELERERQRAQQEHRQPIYSGKCRAVSKEEAARRRTSGEQAAIRLRIPEHPIRFHDIVHGDVEFSSEVVSDPIILRSSGMPVYNYVVVIDDALMKITHVIRGDDHLSNTPKQVALYEALGWPPPEFAHLSTILGGDRERLSKRHGATSIANFREMGVLPEALVNYLALLGWAPPGGDREIFSREELIKEFDLKRVTPSPAIFDFEKLYWLNRHYIKQKSSRDLLALAIPYLVRAGMLGPEIASLYAQFAGAGGGEPPAGIGIAQPQADWLQRVVELFAPAVDRLEQLPERAALIFNFEPQSAIANPENAEVLAWPHTKAVLSRFAAKVFEETADDGGPALTAEQFKKLINDVKAETGAKGKELFHPIRLAITGAHSGPEFDKIIPLIEEGARLGLPRAVKSVRQRLREFLEAWNPA